MYNVINDVLIGLNRVGGVFYDYTANVFIQSALLVILLFIIDLLLRKRYVPSSVTASGCSCL